MSPPVEPALDRLGRASRRAAGVTLLGFLAVMAAFGYAYQQLRRLERQSATLKAEQAELRMETQRYQAELQTTRDQLAKERRALQSGRAAINAFHAGNLQAALSLYDDALNSDPENAYLQNLRAYTLFRLGRVQPAIDGELRSVAIDPAYAWGYLDLARFLCAASPAKMTDARRAAEKAMELRPDLRAIMQGDGEFQRVCRHEIP